MAPSTAAAYPLDLAVGSVAAVYGCPDPTGISSTPASSAPDAGNLIHELVAAAVGITIDQVSQVIHIHPTLAEGVNAAAGGVHWPSSDD